LIVLTLVLLAMWMLAAAASAAPVPEDLWEKLFGCEGIFPISCPGPLPW
jgi:hypothetical protein